MEPRPTIRFADFTFDPTTGEVVGPDGAHRLQPQPAAVLELLASRAGELVTRAELRRAVWPDTRVEFDQGINFCIRQIRSALGESAEDPRFIETLPRRGYRFLVPVEGSVGAAAHAPARPFARRLAPWATVGALALAALLVGLRWMSTGMRRPAGVTVVVLPFQDPDTQASVFTAFNRALGDALVLELTAADGGRLGVIGPLTTAPLVREGTSPTVIGGRLGADFVVSGGARSMDSTIFLQAVRQVDGTHVVAKRFPVGDRTPEALAAEMSAFALGALRAPGGDTGREPPDGL